MIKVFLFAVLAEAAGCREVDISSESMSVAEIKSHLSRRFSGGSEQLPVLLEQSFAAVNQEYVEDSHIVTAKDEVALIPPVSGG